LSRLLAIDYGTKRVGLAVTDPQQIIATALDTVPAATVLDYLKKYVATEPVTAFVLGMPRRLDGSPTDATPHVTGFARRLQQTFPEVPVHLVNEQFSSRWPNKPCGTAASKRRIGRQSHRG
jgi:putative Holliday junction resolvase